MSDAARRVSAAVLTADDPAIVHMILELHQERLEEELAARRKALAALEGRIVMKMTASSR